MDQLQLMPDRPTKYLLPQGTWCTAVTVGHRNRVGYRSGPSVKRRKTKRAKKKPGLSEKHTDSALLGRARLEHILGGGCSASKFLSRHWEKTHLLIRRDPGALNRFADLCCRSDVIQLLGRGVLNAPRDLSATQYVHGARVDLTGGRMIDNVDKATALDQWFQKQRGSLRLLRPQAHVQNLWDTLSELEEFFQISWGSNVYLTPAKSQGFSPHYDDVDVFICQVEGSKRWRLYDGGIPKARYSSEDFGPDDDLGNKILDVVLHPGDLLFFPRGTIHQADTKNTNDDSLHVTLSTGQRWTWADLIDKTALASIAEAARTMETLRTSLPFCFGNFVGVAPQGRDTDNRDAKAVQISFAAMFRFHAQSVFNNLEVNSLTDVMVAKFMKERMPPSPSLLLGAGATTSIKAEDIDESTKVRLAFRGAARMVLHGDGETPVLLHCMSNHRDGAARANPSENDIGVESCVVDEAGAVDFIFRSYPGWVRVREIPLSDREDRIELAQGLVELGVVVAM